MEEARRLEAMADRSATLRHDAEVKKKARETPHKPVWRYVQAMIDTGMTEGDAVRHAALKRGLNEAQARSTWENAKAHDKLVKRWTRNREIMRLARRAAKRRHCRASRTASGFDQPDHSAGIAEFAPMAAGSAD